MQYQIDCHGQSYGCSQCPTPVQSTLAFITQQNVMTFILLLLMDVHISVVGKVYLQQNLLLVHLFLLVCNLFSPLPVSYFCLHFS